jgi:hypothetical protein
VPGRLKRLNYIFLRHDAELDDGLGRIASALRTDIDWVREHSCTSVRVAKLADAKDEIEFGRPTPPGSWYSATVVLASSAHQISPDPCSSVPSTNGASSPAPTARRRLHSAAMRRLCVYSSPPTTASSSATLATAAWCCRSTASRNSPIGAADALSASSPTGGRHRPACGASPRCRHDDRPDPWRGQVPNGETLAALSDDAEQLVTLGGETAQIWHLRWLLTLKGHDLRDAVCTVNLAGASRFTEGDVGDPAPADLAGTEMSHLARPHHSAAWS